MKSSCCQWPCQNTFPLVGLSSVLARLRCAVGGLPSCRCCRAAHSSSHPESRPGITPLGHPHPPHPVPLPHGPHAQPEEDGPVTPVPGGRAEQLLLLSQSSLPAEKGTLLPCCYQPSLSNLLRNGTAAKLSHLIQICFTPLWPRDAEDLGSCVFPVLAARGCNPIP